MSATIYLDYAASTPVAREVVAAVTRVLGEPSLAANPAAGTHAPGRHAAAVVERARAGIAGFINADPDEVLFTSGATEADNLAIVGTARFRRSRGRHLVTALTEHKAVLESCRHLASEGWRVTWLRPGADGLIAPDAVAAALEPDTVLVSLMHANNETGDVTDVAAIGGLCRQRGVLLHVDAAQSAGRLPIDVRAMQVDLLSLSAHKLYGPKGVGALFIDRERVRRVEPLLFGGGQERGMRPGTLPTHQIVGMGEAFRIAAGRLAEDRLHVTRLRDRLWSRLQAIPGVLRNGHPTQTTGHILNVSVAGVEGESLHAALEELAVASGSACT
ncbi:MAG: aminotransferase class V-fold PLP-dependent enzyme, partial [Gammaproteobacteria bacterium]|nr:aminotransferase class V-fold PLP-dependent enzyme [Gammaproteobacteria bacterium]